VASPRWHSAKGRDDEEMQMDRVLGPLAEAKPSETLVIRELDIVEMDEVSGAGLIPGLTTFLRVTLAITERSTNAYEAYNELRR
jgi:hypothetical protein